MNWECPHSKCPISIYEEDGGKLNLVLGGPTFSMGEILGWGGEGGGLISNLNMLQAGDILYFSLDGLMTPETLAPPWSEMIFPGLERFNFLAPKFLGK